MEIRGETISYASYKKGDNQNRQSY